MNLQIQTISACTAKCVFCPHSNSWASKNPGVMDDKVFNKILKDISTIRFDRILPYLMNEPLADKKIFERIEKIKELKNFNQMEIATNASLLDDECSDKLIASLKDIKSEIWISFHGTNEKNFTAIMGLNFQNTFANIRNFLKKTERLSNIKIIIRGSGRPFMKNKNNTCRFRHGEYKRFWRRVFKAINLERVPIIEYFSYSDRAGNIGKEMSFSFRRKTLRGFKCHRTSEWMHFLYTGEMLLCCCDYHKECVLGDIKQQSLQEIMNSPTRKEIIDKIEGHIETPRDFICKRCTKEHV